MNELSCGGKALVMTGSVLFVSKARVKHFGRTRIRGHPNDTKELET